MTIPNHDVISFTQEQKQKLNSLLNRALAVKEEIDASKEDYKAIEQEVDYFQLDKKAFNKLVAEKRKSEDAVTKQRHVELMLDAYRDIVIEAAI